MPSPGMASINLPETFAVYPSTPHSLQVRPYRPSASQLHQGNKRQTEERKNDNHPSPVAPHTSVRTPSTTAAINSLTHCKLREGEREAIGHTAVTHHAHTDRQREGGGESEAMEDIHQSSSRLKGGLRSYSFKSLFVKCRRFKMHPASALHWHCIAHAQARQTSQKIARKMSVPRQAKPKEPSCLIIHPHTKCTSIHPEDRPGRQADWQADIAKTGSSGLGWAGVGFGVRAFPSISLYSNLHLFVGARCLSQVCRREWRQQTQAGRLCVPLSVPIVSSHHAHQAGRQQQGHPPAIHPSIRPARYTHAPTGSEGVPCIKTACVAYRRRGYVCVCVCVCVCASCVSGRQPGREGGREAIRQAAGRGTSGVRWVHPSIHLMVCVWHGVCSIPSR